MRLPPSRALRNLQAGATIARALKDVPAGPVTAAEVRDLLKVGLKSEEELHPDKCFPGDGSEIANTEPSPVSTSLAVANQGEASEGPERAGHKPLMRNPGEMATPRQAHTASDTLSEIDVACDGWGRVWDEVARSFFGK